MDADRIFSGMFKKKFQEILLIPVHVVARCNHKEMRNNGFHCYLNKAQSINSLDKGSLHQYLQGLFFVWYALNVGPVDGTYIALLIVAIIRDFPFTIDISTEAEGHQELYHFEAAS